MFDPLPVAAAGGGLGAAVAAAALMAPGRERTAVWLERHARRSTGGRLPAAWRRLPAAWLAVTLVAGAGAGVGAAVGALVGGPSMAIAPGLLGAGVGPVGVLIALRRRMGAAREQARAELAPLLDLVGVELSAGVPPLLALESVLNRCSGRLAAELSRRLIGSRIAGSDPFDVRLEQLAEESGVPEIGVLALALAMNREFGAAAAPAFRALAADLRAERRRQLLAAGRRALNRVLVPAAAGVLLPFMAILLYPAVVTLLSHLR